MKLPKPNRSKAVYVGDLGSLLTVIGDRPHYWLPIGKYDERRSIRLIETFVSGYLIGQASSKNKFPYDSFTHWVQTHYHRINGSMSGFSMILDKCAENEQLAYDEFFRLLPKFLKDLKRIGPDGIFARLAALTRKEQRNLLKTSNVPKDIKKQIKANWLSERRHSKK